MMKIVLCQINSQYIHSAALAPWSLAAQPAGTAVCPICCGWRMRTSTSRPRRSPTGSLPESRLSSACAAILECRLLRRLLPLLRARLPRAVLLAGGPQASFACGDFWAQNPEFDYLLAGEGERSFSQLLDALEGAGAVREVPGLVWREDGALRQNPPPPPLEELPDPYTADYFAALGGRIAYLETSRGCPFHCAFCLSGREDRLRLLSAAGDDGPGAAARPVGQPHHQIRRPDLQRRPAPGRRDLRFLIERRQAGEIPEGSASTSRSGPTSSTRRASPSSRGRQRGCSSLRRGCRALPPAPLRRSPAPPITTRSARICSRCAGAEHPPAHRPDRRPPLRGRRGLCRGI